MQKGQSNKSQAPLTKSYKDIFRAHFLTFFNFMNICLAALVFMVGSFKNMLFLGVVVFNTAIGIIQEIRAKRTLDELTVLTQPKALVLRDGQKWQIAIDQLVKDDIIYVWAGAQIPADAVMLEGNLEVNESLLTGESQNIQKHPGDELYSGSYVAAGEGYCRLTRVGQDSYAAGITGEAKVYQKHPSELNNAINAILKMEGILIIPLGILLFYHQRVGMGLSLRSSVVSMVAGIQGMIPEGLVLLTSISFTMGAVKLAARHTLVQEPACMETLSRVDVLCLDKTGTITEGNMRVQEVIPWPMPGTPEQALPAPDDAPPGEQENAAGQAQPEPQAMAGEQAVPEEPTVSKENAVPKEPTVSKENAVPKEPTVSKENAVPEEPTVSKENAVPEEPTGAEEHAGPEEMLRLEEHVGLEEPFRFEENAVREDQSRHEEEGQDEGMPAIAKRAAIPEKGGAPERAEAFGRGAFLMEAFRAAAMAAAGQAEHFYPRPEAGQEKPLDIPLIMGNLMRVLKDNNSTAKALRAYFPEKKGMIPENVIPFSSERKYSGCSFEGRGTYLIGAASFLFPDSHDALKEEASRLSAAGKRVLVLAASPHKACEGHLPEELAPVALFVLSDVIRKNAPETAGFFYRQGVELLVISGDDPEAVSAIAKKAGIRSADVCQDATYLDTPEKMAAALSVCHVFGRVTPVQKKEIVEILKSQGHIVAMTGDGVNDVPALKKADCSIAMASGSDAAKNVANLVLLDDNFASMPHVVNQGRRVVNNIRTAASMFMIKAIFSMLLSLISILGDNNYPFVPIQLTLISACAVGMPSFLLALEPNYQKPEGDFLRHVFLNAIPAALTITGCVFVLMQANRILFHSSDMLGTACVLVTGWNYMAALRSVYSPMSWYRKAVIYTMHVVFFAAAAILRQILDLKALEVGMIIVVFMLMTFSPDIITAITGALQGFFQKGLEQEEKKGYQILWEKLLHKAPPSDEDVFRS